MNVTAADLKVLRAFNFSGPLTVTELSTVMARSDGLRQACERLWSNRCLDAERPRGHSFIYTISAKGRRILGKHEPEMGEFPQPRSRISSGTYTPPPIYTRPGSQDFLALHSRRGNELVAHRAPMSLASGVA